MNFLTDNSHIMMEKSMDYLWTKQAAILDNITNAETPNYKTKYVTFEDTLKEKLENAVKDSFPAAAVWEALTDTEATVHKAGNESTRMDGNGVNITEQNIELARNAFQLQYSMNSISSEFRILRTAIRG